MLEGTLSSLACRAHRLLRNLKLSMAASGVGIKLCCAGLLLPSSSWPSQQSLASSQQAGQLHNAIRLRSKATLPPPRKGWRCRRAMAMALPVEVDATTAVLASTGTLALSFGALRTYVYFKMQYIIAAMLGRHVPRGGARVLDLGIREGRNLYYYPKDTVQVAVITPMPNVQLLESQAIRAGVPIKIISKASEVSGLPANSMDAVVSVYGMADMTDEQVASALREGVRVLKPGMPFIYIENVGADGGVVRATQELVESIRQTMGGKSRVTRDVLPFVQGTEGLEDFQYERILEFQDPHLVGIATKKLAVSAASGVGKEKVPKKNKKGKQ